MAAPPASTPLPFSVSGKTAIVTGAGSGINLEFARLLLAHNCNVVFADLSLRPEAQALVDEHSTGDGGGGGTTAARALFVKTDVTSWPELRQLFSATLAAFGDFDVVCPGAGVYEPAWSSFWHPPGSAPASRDAPDGGRYALLDINVTHPIRATQLALSLWLHPPASAAVDGGEEGEGGGAIRMRQRRAPAHPATNPKRVVHISSIAGQIANINTPLYTASKFAISGFVRSLAPLEPRAGVRVAAVAPGIIKTPLWTEHPEKLLFLDEGRDGWASPQEVAAAMLRCVEEPDIVGGTILEVGKGNTRVVEAFNDPGPSKDPRDGLIASNIGKGTEEIWAWLEDEAIWGLKD